MNDSILPSITTIVNNYSLPLPSIIITIFIHYYYLLTTMNLYQPLFTFIKAAYY